MKFQTSIIAIITIVLFSITAIILFKGCIQAFNRHDSELKETYLNTDSMKEADNFIDRVYGNAVITAYICDKKNIENDSVPWADVFVCKIFKDTSSINADTIVFIDTQLRKPDRGGSYDIYWPDVKEARKFKKCKILIPKTQINFIKRLKYKYGTVTLVTDD